MTTPTLETLSANQGLLVDTAGMAAVALIAYLFGRRTRRAPAAATPKHALLDANLREELGHAQQIAHELEQSGSRLRTEEAAYRASLAEFQHQVKRMQTGEAPGDWRRFSEQADALVEPTMKFAGALAQAYDQLRQQQAQLLTFAGSRIDPATSLQNRRAMEEQLNSQLSLHADGTRKFSLAVFSLSSARQQGEAAGDGRLRAIARLLEDCIRAHDFVARYSEDEFAVLMPQTPAAGALVFSERLLRRAHADLCCPLWGGVVEARPKETPEKLLLRADSALYSARTNDQACLFQHNGSAVRRHQFSLTAPESSDGAPAAAGEIVSPPAVAGRAG